MNRMILLLVSIVLTPGAFALQCGSTPQTAQEIRNLQRNRGPVTFDGQVRYGAYTVNGGNFGGKWSPSLFCGMNGPMFQYRPGRGVEFFDCRGGQVYYDVNGSSGVNCF